MKKTLQLIIVLALSTIPAWSQTCSVAAFKTQADVDNFSTAYPGCRVVNGDLQIVSSTINNLDGLRNVSQVTGSFKINQNPNLTSIAGMSSLAQVDFGLSISGNDNLLTLDGLDHLTSVRNISVINNKKLTSIYAFNGISTIGNLAIETNPALTNLNGLHNISKVRGALKIVGNDNLIDLNGLRRVSRVESGMRIVNNDILKNLKGLERLETLIYQFTTYFEISGNKALTSIAELSQVQGDVEVRITNNPLLSDCAVKLLCQRIAVGEATISRNADGCSTEEIRTSSVCSPQTLVRINAGGPAFTTATQKLFVADQYYAGIDRTSSIASGDILNTTNDVLYRSGRCSPSFSYNIPVVNELVNVTLHFAETYFGAPGKKGGAGSRQFNVDIEGSRKLTNYDIFAEAGGALRAVQLTIPVRVTDGMLNIDFLTGAADLPRVSAIEVTASPTLIPVADGLVNIGQGSNMSYGSEKYLSVRRYLNQGPTYVGDALTYIKFQIPVGKAEITSAKLRLYTSTHWESVDIHAYGVNDDSWTEETLTGNNAPAASTSSLGSTTVNDVAQHREIDVTSYVNAQRQSGDVLVSFMLDDPNKTSVTASVNSKESGALGPQLVYQTTPIVQAQNGTARVGQEEILTEVQEKQPSIVFPNPIKDRFTLDISPSHQGKVDLQLTSMTGYQVQLQSLQSVAQSSKLEVNLPGKMPAGIYLWKVQSEGFSEVLKVLITE